MLQLLVIVLLFAFSGQLLSVGEYSLLHYSYEKVEKDHINVLNTVIILLIVIG